MQFPFHFSYVENVYQGSLPFPRVCPRGILRKKRRWIPRAKPESYSNPVKLNRAKLFLTGRNLSFSFDRVTRASFRRDIANIWRLFFSFTGDRHTGNEDKLKPARKRRNLVRCKFTNTFSLSLFAQFTLNYSNLFLLVTIASYFTR